VHCDDPDLRQILIKGYQSFVSKLKEAWKKWQEKQYFLDKLTEVLIPGGYFPAGILTSPICAAAP